MEHARHVDPILLVGFPVFVLSLVVHEYAHGRAALWRGDPTARDAGRLTLGPVPHLDGIGMFVVPGVLLLAGAPFLFGWAKPVPVDRGRLRDPRNDPVWVALAGPLSNILLALACAAAAALAPERGFFAPLGAVAVAGVVWNCTLAFVNLIPLPPLDGSWVLMRFLRLRHIVALHHLRFLGFALMAVALSAPAASRVLFQGPLEATVGALLGVFGARGLRP